MIEVAIFKSFNKKQGKFVHTGNQTWDHKESVHNF